MFGSAKLSPFAHPLRTAYLTAGAASAVAAAIPSDRVTKVVKPTLMPLLAADAIRRRAPLSVALGLLGGLAGDVILMGKDSRSPSTQTRAANLNKGAAAFTLNQVAYHVALAKAGARIRKLPALARLPIWVGGAGIAAALLPKALPAAAGYGAALALTSTLAQDANPTAALGGNLFILSDGLILQRLTLLKNFPRLDALTDGAVMATYVLAQLFLVDGMCKKV
ncbi:lysoplasmalogenase family protein [Corynebacterium heidelbergense]|uniref:Lysoplasmalogenase n=1 Tax=Corynebacterium heidelbergense TaxID=2055947 RepID=A0A364V635_9CORY|nr:lysoplasmalogenase family protein [Corynebacterium heidelbergense]RAV32066.1 lysoplasmalogenase [Corynebacterium heidelbergense]